MLTPVASTELVSRSQEAIDALKTAAGMTDAQFAAFCMPVLRCFADHVQRLPLTANAFGSPTGAWDFGLVAATVAYRYAGTVIFFPSLGAEERRLLEPQCRYMAFLSTLASAVATVAESSILVAGDDEYHPLSIDQTLHAWLSSHPSTRFVWRVPAVPLSAQAGAAIAANFIPRRLLANFDLRAVLMMYEAINPKTTMNGVESTLARVVRQSSQGVLEHYKSKQAGTFQPEATVPVVSPVDAGKVASNLIAVANPTNVVNPLETPAMATPAPGGNSGATPSGEASVSGSLAATHSEPTAPSQQAVTVDTAASFATTPAQPATGAASEAEEKLARGHKVLREWFSALKQHPQFPALKDQLVMNDTGIEVPVSMLGMFGVSGATVRKMMDDAGLILGRTSNARGIILHAGLRDRFIAH